MLPANVTSFVIRHLAEGSNYVFQVRAIAPQGAGRLAEILLTTPLRPDPSRRKKSHHRGTKKSAREPQEQPKSEEAVTATSAARAMKPAVPDLTTSAARAEKPAVPDLTTSNYSILNNLDPEKLIGPQKSEPRIVKNVEIESLPSFSPTNRRFSSAIYTLTLLLVKLLL